MKGKTSTKEKSSGTNTQGRIGEFLGRMYSFNVSLKLYHWHVSGKGSYAEHIALDQALADLSDALDRIVETSYTAYGPVKIVMPQTEAPQNIVEHAEKFFEYANDQRELFTYDFSTAIIDDYQEAIQQLLYRLRRLE